VVAATAAAAAGAGTATAARSTLATSSTAAERRSEPAIAQAPKKNSFSDLIGRFLASEGQGKGAKVYGARFCGHRDGGNDAGRKKCADTFFLRRERFASRSTHASSA